MLRTNLKDGSPVTILERTGVDLQGNFQSSKMYYVGGNPYYEDFVFVNPWDFSNEGSNYGSRFIVAYTDNKIVGVLKVKRYAKRTHDYVPEELAQLKKTYLAVRYIDVRSDFKGLGVASCLISYFNSLLTQGELIILSNLSTEGRKVKLKALFKRLCPTSTIKTYREYFG